MTLEMSSVYCYVHAIDRQGAERVLRYVTVGDDHAAAAEQANRALHNYSDFRVTQIETFDGPPRRWDPRDNVEEIR